MVAVDGDVDVLTAPQLRERIVELLAEGRNRLAVDLGPTDFLDSSGLSVLVTGVKRARSVGGDVVLVCPPGKIRRLLEVVAFDQVFTLYDSLEELAASPAPRSSPA